MSLVVSWISVDTHGISSAYLMSDSRVSWEDNSSYDCCRKVFYFKNYPEIIAYCGDVLFPSLLIGLIIDCIDNGMIFSPGDNAVQRFKKFKKILFDEFHKYPKNKMSNSFEIIYINKDISEKNYPNYYAYEIKWDKKKQFSSKTIELPKQSEVIFAMGSGASEFKDYYEKVFRKKKNKGTSRNIFQCFVDLLPKIKDFHCGGAPQLVGLKRKPFSNGEPYGIVYQRKRFYLGISIGMPQGDSLEWRNKYFERCDGKTKERLPDAKDQSLDLQD